MATFVNADRLYETSITTGTGTYTLDGAVTGFQPISTIGANNQCAYFATDDTNWEVGIGTYLASPARLQRDTILASSNGGSAVNWGSGTRKIRCGLPAEMAFPRALSKSVAGSSNVTLTQDEQRRRALVFTGALTGNIDVIVDATVWDWIVYNNTTGAYTLTLKVSGQTGVVVPQKRTVALRCDGTDVERSHEGKGRVLSRTSDTVLGVDNFSDTIRATSGYTQTFDAVATLGDGWWCGFRVESGATLVLDPSGSETIDGATTLSIAGPASGMVVCNGSALYTVGYAARQSITLGTEQASTSGTAIDFTGIPTGTKRITINFAGVSTNGSSAIIVQLGDSGGVETSGYLGAGSYVGSGGSGSSNYTNGIGFPNIGSTNALHGSITLTLEDAANFHWCASGALADSNSSFLTFAAGAKATSAEVDRVRITMANGTDTFDAGAINITYEG